MHAHENMRAKKRHMHFGRNMLGFFSLCLSLLFSLINSFRNYGIGGKQKQRSSSSSACIFFSFLPQNSIRQFTHKINETITLNAWEWWWLLWVCALNQINYIFCLCRDCVATAAAAAIIIVQPPAAKFSTNTSYIQICCKRICLVLSGTHNIFTYCFLIVKTNSSHFHIIFITHLS